MTKADINEMGTKRAIQRINKTKSSLAMKDKQDP
jgi:hypothetical protein